MRHTSLFKSFVTVLIIGSFSTLAHANWWDFGDRVTGLGKSIQETRQVSDFTEVELATQGTLFIEIGDEFKVVVEGQKNLQEFIVTRVRRGTLEIYTEEDVWLRPTRSLKYHVTMPRLDEIILSSSGDAVISDLSTDRFRITCESSGDLEIGDLVCDDLYARLSSSGDVYIDSWEGKMLTARLGSSGDLEIGRGSTDEQDIELKSSGDYLAKNLESRTATVYSGSSGDAHIRVSETLYARRIMSTWNCPSSLRPCSAVTQSGFCIATGKPGSKRPCCSIG